MALRLGLDARLYRNTGSYASPTWNFVQNVKDLTLNLEVCEADVSTRGTGGWRATVSALKDASIEFELVWDTADDDFAVIRDAFLTRGALDFAVMDGDITTPGSQGLRAICMIASFSRNEALEEALTVSVTAKPTYAAFAPVWLVIT